MSRQFSYYPGQITEEHKANSKIKSTATTQLVSHIILSDGRTISYEYDAEERITKITDSVDGTTEYTYDALGQLLTETVNGTAVNTMTYDNYGNILTKNGTVYEYDSTWKDLLVKVGNNAISYDAQGNPTSYLGHTLTWEKGRQLKSFDSNTYTYNANGIRTSKTVNGVEHKYFLDGTKILRETWGENVLIPLYDNEETVCGIVYNDMPYYFLKNLQGDIVSIVDKDADIVARYSYDAWGVCTVELDESDVGIANINPFRYRCYYYDSEIGFYYVSSRYYDPRVGRWLNSDLPEMVGLSNISSDISVTNLFTYCSNNPTNDKDITGYISANKIANIFSISMLFAMFMPVLYASYSKGLVAVGAYATKIATPIAVKAFWWKPWLAAALILAAVAIVVGAVAIYFNSQMNKTVEEVLKTKKGSIKNAPLPPGGPNWKDILKKTMKEIKSLAQKGVKGYKEIWKLLTDSRFNK